MTLPIPIKLAQRDDAEALHLALSALSRELDDTHRATTEGLLAAGWGPFPVFRAQLAEEAGKPFGVALYSPVFSTVGGDPGVFVSDLWVTQGLRKTGLGRRLLSAAMRDGTGLWGATFLKLTVGQTNSRARAFYDCMGFRPALNDTNMFIDAEVLTNPGVPQ